MSSFISLFGSELNSALGQTLAIVLGGVILATPVAAWRWTSKHVATPLKQVPEIVRKMGNIQIQVDSISSQLEPIAEQFLVNHGHSMRDANDRTEILARAVADRMGLDSERVSPSVEPLPK